MIFNGITIYWLHTFSDGEFIVYEHKYNIWKIICHSDGIWPVHSQLQINNKELTFSLKRIISKNEDIRIISEVELQQIKLELL